MLPNASVSIVSSATNFSNFMVAWSFLWLSSSTKQEKQSPPFHMRQNTTFLQELAERSKVSSGTGVHHPLHYPSLASRWCGIARNAVRHCLVRELKNKPVVSDRICGKGSFHSNGSHRLISQTIAHSSVPDHCLLLLLRLWLFFDRTTADTCRAYRMYSLDMIDC